jgi:transposase
MKKQHITLSQTDREELESFINKGEHPAREIKRALALLALDDGKTYTEVAQMVHKTNQTVSTWAKNYREQGLDCLKDAPRSGRPTVIDGLTRAQVTALACSEPPEGYAQWSVRLLADKAIELGYTDQISKTTVADILKKTS